MEWREDFLDGWDFYDVSQALEMQKRGYQVVVPYPKEAWCYHDCVCSKLEKYDFYRERMLEEYREYFGVYNGIQASIFCSWVNRFCKRGCVISPPADRTIALKEYRNVANDN